MDERKLEFIGHLLSGRLWTRERCRTGREAEEMHTRVWWSPEFFVPGSKDSSGRFCGNWELSLRGEGEIPLMKLAYFTTAQSRVCSLPLCPTLSHSSNMIQKWLFWCLSPNTSAVRALFSETLPQTSLSVLLPVCVTSPSPNPSHYSQAKPRKCHSYGLLHRQSQLQGGEMTGFLGAVWAGKQGCN